MSAAAALSDIALVFPGQGSQRQGMLSAYDTMPAVADAVAEVGAALGCDLAAMIEHDGDALNQTVNTQPAMLAMGVGVYRAGEEYLPPPLCVAGHSLGEYSALVCAGALTLTEAARLVRRRAEYMQNAVSDGAMAALLGARAEVVEEQCAALRAQGAEVWPANYNSELQIVIAGRRAAVEQAIDRLKTAGAKRAVLLPMSVPSHCPLLAAAAQAFQADLMRVKWRSLTCPVLHCAMTADDGSGVPLIVQRLTAQLTQPVNWLRLLEVIKAGGVETVLELGPGKVLTGLGRKSGLAHLALDSGEAISALR